MNVQGEFHCTVTELSMRKASTQVLIVKKPLISLRPIAAITNNATSRVIGIYLWPDYTDIDLR